MFAQTKVNNFNMQEVKLKALDLSYGDRSEEVKCFKELMSESTVSDIFRKRKTPAEDICRG